MWTQALELTEQLACTFKRDGVRAFSSQGWIQRLDPSDLRKAYSHSVTEPLFFEAPKLFSFFTDFDRQPSEGDLTFTSLISLSKCLKVKIVNINSQSGPHSHDIRHEQATPYTDV